MAAIFDFRAFEAMYDEWEEGFRSGPGPGEFSYRRGGPTSLYGTADMVFNRYILGRLPEESSRRWEATTREWPLMHALLYGVSRDKLMARHKSNHITVSYAPDAKTANEIAFAKASMARALGFKVYLCGKLDTAESVEYKAENGLAVEGPHL